MQTKAAEEWVTKNGRRSIDALLKPISNAVALSADSLRPFEIRGEKYFLPRFSFRGPNSSDPIRIGIFAAIHGDEPAGALAVVKFLLDLVAEPALAEDYQIHAYPICNPTGFEDNTRCSRNGHD